MSRSILIKVTPQYHTVTGKCYQLKNTFYNVIIPFSKGITKRDLAQNGRILRDLRYFSRFVCFSEHLLEKFRFRLEIIDLSNHQSYITVLHGSISSLFYSLF